MGITSGMTTKIYPNGITSGSDDNKIISTGTCIKHPSKFFTGKYCLLYKQNPEFSMSLFPLNCLMSLHVACIQSFVPF